MAARSKSAAKPAALMSSSMILGRAQETANGAARGLAGGDGVHGRGTIDHGTHGTTMIIRIDGGHTRIRMVVKQLRSGNLPCKSPRRHHGMGREGSLLVQCPEATRSLRT